MKEGEVTAIIQELVRRTNDEFKRLRDLEQRMQGLENKLGTSEDSTLKRTKKINDKITEYEIKLKNFEEEILKIKTSMEKLTRQSNTYAKQRDLREIERMLELLNPVKQIEKKLEEDEMFERTKIKD